MKINVLFYFIVGFCSIQSQAQDLTEMEYLEQSLCQNRASDLDLATESGDFVSTKTFTFGQNLESALSLEASWTYPFRQLKKQIRIVESIDKRIRTFSWDTHRGGTWHELESYIQYKEGTVLKVQPLHLQDGGYTDVIYYQIDNFEHKKGRIYLLSGFGTHGGGHHHKIMRAFRKEGNQLIELKNAFNGEQYLTIIATRRDKIKVAFERNGLIIRFNEFSKLNSDHDGFSQAIGKEITYAWDGEQFIQF
jgi:hypothetical protein